MIKNTGTSSRKSRTQQGAYPGYGPVAVGSPVLASRTPVWRSKFIVAGLALAFLGLAVKAAYVQVVGNAFYKKQGEVRFERTLSLPANRGEITDRNGLLLASSVPTPSIWASPEGIDRKDTDKLNKLALLLQLSPADLHKKLLDSDKGFVWLKRQVTEDVAQKIMALKIRGVYQRKEYRRHYPEGEAMAHVVGFNDIEDSGQEGIERVFNGDLAGKNGAQRVIKDRFGGVVEAVGDFTAPIEGKDYQLSIDSKVQFFAYQKLRDAVHAHKAKSGSAVIIDVKTGEILALANYPGFNPEDRRTMTPAVVRNRALTDSFEPGSTMKPFVVAQALDLGLIKPDTIIPTDSGKLTIDDAVISDAHPHGDLTVNGIVQKSSNVGTVKIAMRMTSKDMWEMYRKVGFGEKPDFAFPGIVAGRLRNYRDWRRVEKATMSYGYGMSSSLFHLAQAYTVFAKDGQRIPITLLKQTDEAVEGEQVIKPATARAVRNMLHLVTQTGGTGVRAQTMGYSVAGKTGTARKQEGKGYALNKYRSFFVGMAPTEAPRIVVAVLIDEPSNGEYYGGDVAAPVFAETVQQTLRMLGVAPDLAVRPLIVTKAEQESF